MGEYWKGAASNDSSTIFYTIGTGIGGGPSNIGEPLRKLIDDLVKERQLDFISSTTPIKIDTTKNDAGMFQAAFWAISNNKNKRY